MSMMMVPEECLETILILKSGHLAASRRRREAGLSWFDGTPDSAQCCREGASSP
jgi:hypothetical protein